MFVCKTRTTHAPYPCDRKYRGKGEEFKRRTWSVSKVIRSGSDSHASLVSPRDQGIHHWRKVSYQVVCVQVLYCICVAKSGNSRFHSRRILHCICIFVVHKSKIHEENKMLSVQYWRDWTLCVGVLRKADTEKKMRMMNYSK